MTQSKIKRLMDNVDPTARISKGFGLWSFGMMIAWLKQNQKKGKK